MFILAAGTFLTPLIALGLLTPKGLLGQVAVGAPALVLGFLLGLILLWSWGLRPTAWRRHWRTSCSRFEGSNESRSGLWLYGRQHWHTLAGVVRCTVQAPGGTSVSAERSPPFGRAAHITQPGDGVGFEFPNDFGARWPAPGKYKVRWEFQDASCSRSVILGRATWIVEAD
jgi:hypothetical protein